MNRLSEADLLQVRVQVWITSPCSQFPCRVGLLVEAFEGLHRKLFVARNGNAGLR